MQNNILNYSRVNVIYVTRIGNFVCYTVIQINVNITHIV